MPAHGTLTLPSFYGHKNGPISKDVGSVQHDHNIDFPWHFDMESSPVTDYSCQFLNFNKDQLWIQGHVTAVVGKSTWSGFRIGLCMFYHSSIKVKMMSGISSRALLPKHPVHEKTTLWVHP